ncbi:MAG: dihydrofolate reductase family protein [Bacteroidia bacterium]|nr:dihydrofolate reductase family protein [Bacteroidia bacterium]
METPRKLILYIAMSLDGYIAAPGDNLDFLSRVEKEGEDYGYQAFTAQVDTVFLGRKTYEKVLSMGVAYHPDKAVYVFTQTPRPPQGSAVFYTGDPASLLETLRAQPGQHIYCDGGAELVDVLLRRHLLDELIISVIPVLLGEGIRLFRDARPETPLTLVGVRSYETGLVQLHYARP